MIHQRGQSMTEFAVGAASVCLLMLGTIAISGYQETQRRMAVAARQAAFMSAWSHGRFNAAAMTRALADRNLDDAGLTEPSGRSRIVHSEDLIVSTATRQPDGLASTAHAVLLTPLRAAGGFLGNSFDLSTGNFQSGRLSLPVAPMLSMPRPFSQLSLEFHQPFALQADAWNASGPQHVIQRTGGLVPGSRLVALQALWQPLLAPASLIEPSIAQLCFGLIEPDRIPEDRLGPGRASLPGRCP